MFRRTFINKVDYFMFISELSFYSFACFNMSKIFFSLAAPYYGGGNLSEWRITDSNR